MYYIVFIIVQCCYVLLNLKQSIILPWWGGRGRVAVTGWPSRGGRCAVVIAVAVAVTVAITVAVAVVVAVAVAVAVALAVVVAVAVAVAVASAVAGGPAVGQKVLELAHLTRKEGPQAPLNVPSRETGCAVLAAYSRNWV